MSNQLTLGQLITEKERLEGIVADVNRRVTEVREEARSARMQITHINKMIVLYGGTVQTEPRSNGAKPRGQSPEPIELIDGNWGCPQRGCDFFRPKVASVKHHWTNSHGGKK